MVLLQMYFSLKTNVDAEDRNSKGFLFFDIVYNRDVKRTVKQFDRLKDCELIGRSDFI